MLAMVQIPGFGPAAAGLDWLELPGMDGKRTEIQQLGRTVDAAWQYVWAVKGAEHEYVAFATKGESKTRPVAAGALAQVAIAEDLYLALVDIGDERFWLFATVGGLPQARMDLVGEVGEVLGLARDFLNTVNSAAEVPIYTDKAELFESFPYASDLDIRPFSLEILAHSIQKRDYAKAKFDRYTTAPVFQLVIVSVVVCFAIGYYFYQVQAEEAAIRDAVLVRERAIAQRKAELDSAVKAALNSYAQARIAVPAYLDATRTLKNLVGGWKLVALECSGAGCTLTYEAQAFATWASYLKNKPVDWPEPIFDGDIEKVTQPIPVNLPTPVQREAGQLPKRDEVRLEIGNLAQVSKVLGLTLTLPNSWNRVAGNQLQTTPEEQWVPVTGSFDVTGPAALLRDIASRLPSSCDITSVNIRLTDTQTFELRGKAYANP